MQKPKATTLTPESIDLFRSSLSAKGRSERTIKAYTTDLKMFLQALETEEIPAEEYEETGMNWLTVTKSQVAAKTTNRRLTSLKQFAKWAGWDASFTEYYAPKPLRGQPHPLPEGVEGVRRMIAATSSDRHAALIALCGLVGLRISEALAVEPGDFDLHKMTLKVRGKGDKQRLVPVSEEAWEILANPVTRAFCNRSGTVVGMQDRAARAMVTRVARTARLKRAVSSHDLRATFATEVYNKTLDQRLVQLLMGHANGSTTEIYVGRTFDQMREGVVL